MESKSRGLGGPVAGFPLGAGTSPFTATSRAAGAGRLDTFLAFCLAARTRRPLTRRFKSYEEYHSSVSISSPLRLPRSGSPMDSLVEH